MDKGIIQKIQFEIEQIDELINESSPLLDLVKIKAPDFVERCGIALILQSFYNGIEKILLLIVKHKDKKLPNGMKWHKELLENAFNETNNRTVIFKVEFKETLNDYLQFRHFVRHSYGFQLKWERMKQLILDMSINWEKIKEEINIFMEKN